LAESKKLAGFTASPLMTQHLTLPELGGPFLPAPDNARLFVKPSSLLLPESWSLHVDLVSQTPQGLLDRFAVSDKYLHPHQNASLPADAVPS
jgi:hypothetical protein